MNKVVPTMSRLQLAQQMVMANNPANGDVTSNMPGAVFAPGGAEPNNGTDVNAWAAMTDGYYQAAAAATKPIPIFYGLDAVHGNNGSTGTVIFPHNAGMASSRNAAFVKQVAQIEASEILAAGVNWAFGPFAGTTWDYRWGRVYESFSEDPTWAGEMLTAEIQGFQGDGGLGSSSALVACSKHAAGDGQGGPPSSKGGVVDRGNAQIDDATMEQWGLAQYVPAINAGLGCIMVSDARWNNASMTTSSHLMTDLVKKMYGFKGFIITDWDAADGSEAAAVNAGVDMLMAPDDPWQTAITRLNAATSIPLTRMQDAVTRILNVKCQAGIMSSTDGSAVWKRDPTLIAGVGSAAHRMIGEQAVQQSLVLLQNNMVGGKPVLPLAKTAKVYVDGSGSDSLNNQCGGWTIAWQGAGSMTKGTTIKQAISAVATVSPLADADVAIIVLSEGPYAEFEGDSKTLDTLPAADWTLLQAARASGKPVVAIVTSGRPVLLGKGFTNADAWVAAWLPGTEGEGVADVLFGDAKFTGKLSHSWPAADDNANIMCAGGGTVSPTVQAGYAGIMCPNGYKPQFALGFGLTD